MMKLPASSTTGNLPSAPPAVEQHPLRSAAGGRFDIDAIRADFPILRTMVRGRPLVYLDNAATTQKPQSVITAESRFYAAQNSNIHRGVYQLSIEATDLYEQARRKVQRFLNAKYAHEIIFTRGTTEAINLVAHSFGRKHLREGDEILLSAMEHHSNIVPWQMACEQAGATIRVIPMNDAGELLMDEYEKHLTDRTKLVAIVHVSNSLGTINPVGRIIELAHRRGVPVLVDGAQWVAHGPTDVQALDADFYAFSAHKLFGPTGVGALYGREKWLETMPPYQGGGDMIEQVTFAKTTFAPLPSKFEAGTPNIAGVIGLGAAIDYVQALNWSFVDYEHELLSYATAKLAEIPGVRLIGTAREKASVLSFVVAEPPISALDLGTRLDSHGIAVRTGHHCCQPVMDRFGIPATTRASLAAYTSSADVDAFVSALQEILASTPRQPKSVPASSPATGTVTYPEPSAPSPQEAADELAEMFELLGDRDSRNQYILELGEKIPPMPATLKTEQTRVHGCMSTVHLFGQAHAGTNKLDFVADSDAHIVRGLIGVLEKLYAGQPAPQVLEFDIEGFFHRIGLDQFISSQRRNGLAGMIKRIRFLAQQIVQSAS